MNTGQITDPTIHIKPSKQLIQYIRTISISTNPPLGVANIIYKNKIKGDAIARGEDLKLLVTNEDYEFMKTLKLNPDVGFSKLPLKSESTILPGDRLLNVQDLHWLYNYIQENRDKNENIFLHELLADSDIILPKNSEIPRNAELEKRCERLRASQQNKEYSNMTKNVDVNRRKHPEDTVAFQIKMMNRHLIAIFQFIMSVAAGFAFGFVGIELLIGSLDFGFRLLLGIICALIIALAELYFLAKKLNEDLKFETNIEVKKKGAKLD